MKKDTINKKEIDKFSKLADEWWDPEGKFKPLHNFNPVRLRYIKDTITKKFGYKMKISNLKKKNNKGFTIVELIIVIAGLAALGSFSIPNLLNSINQD